MMEILLIFIFILLASANSAVKAAEAKAAKSNISILTYAAVAKAAVAKDKMLKEEAAAAEQARRAVVRELAAKQAVKLAAAAEVESLSALIEEMENAPAIKGYRKGAVNAKNGIFSIREERNDSRSKWNRSRNRKEGKIKRVKPAWRK